MLGYNLFNYFSCLSIFLGVCLCKNVIHEHLKNYIDDLQKSTTNKLTDFRKNRLLDFELDITFEKAQYTALSNNNTTDTFVSIFDNNCIIVGSQIYILSFTNNSFVLKKSSQDRLSFLQEAKLVRVTKYSNFWLLLVSALDHFSIYIKSNVTTGWLFVQTISTENIVPDAIFFMNEDQLYLIVLITGDYSSKIYKWTGAGFDEIDQLITKNAFSVSSFNDKRSEIILILQKQQNQSNVLTFEFNNNKSKKIELIVNSCNHIVTYAYKGKQYLAVLEETQSSVLYRWNGIEFIQVGRFNSFSFIQNTFLVYLNGAPTVLVFDQNGLLAFHHFMDNWRLITSVAFDKNVEKVLDVTIMVNTSASTLLVFYQDKNREIGYMLLPFKVYISQTGSSSKLNEVIECMLTLEMFVKNYTMKKEPSHIFNKTVILVSEEPKYNESVLTSASHSTDVNVTVSFPSELQITAIEQQIRNITKRINYLRDKLRSLYTQNGTLNSKFIVRGNLKVNQLNANNLTVKDINGVRWNSNVWLSYTKSQTITGSVFAKNLIVKNLTVPKHTKPFHSILLQSGNQNVTGTFYLKSLKANNIYIEKINDIAFENVYLRNSPSLIRGIKHFDVLNVTETNVTYLNKGNATDAILQLSNTQPKNYIISLNAYVENFYFEEINGIVWKDFKNSVFQSGSTNRIKGNINIGSVKCNKLETKKLGKIEALSLFTTTTDQNIKSTIHWKHVLTQNVKCDKLNNVSFSDIAFANNIIKGPVSIDRTHIKGNLFINYPNNTLNSDVEDHVIGTHVSDLVQKYNKRVKIIGNLHLENLIVFPETNVVVNNQDFNESVINCYWSKSKFQNVPFFHAQNGITTSHLSTITINNVHVSQYLINDLEDKLPVKWVFKNIEIRGNVEVNPLMTHKPNLQEIDLVSVKRNGRFNISNKITVQGNMRVKNLITNYLDDVKIADTMSSKTSSQILNESTIANLIVRGDVVCKSIVTKAINNVDLENLESAVLYVNKDEYIENLWCDNVIADNVNLSYLNGDNFNNYIQYLNQVSIITNIDTLKVNGKVKIYDTENVIYINSYKVEELEAKNLDQHVFTQNVKILGTVFADTIQIVYVNNVNFSELFERVLLKGWDQNITALYKFDQVNTPNIFVPKINDVFVQNLINIKSTAEQTLLVPETLVLSYPKFMKSVNSEKFLCDLQGALTILQNPPNTYWNIVEVSNNVTLWDTTCSLNTIMNEAVHSKKENYIFSQVTFDHHVSANNVILKKRINNVHLNDIFSDAVLKDVSEQIITGRKVFHKLTVANAFAEMAYIPVINDIDINVLNYSIIDSNNIYNSVIKGPKLFYGGLQTNQLLTSAVSHLDPQNLVTLNNLRVIPKAYFQNLHVDHNFDVVFVNNQNFSYFLSQRLLYNSTEIQIATGTYYIRNVELLGNAKAPAVNNVNIDDIVLDEGNQLINASKCFNNTVYVDKNLVLTFLNGHKLSLLYNNSILLGKDATMERPIKFNNISMYTDVDTEYLNGIPIADFEDYIRIGSPILQKDVIRRAADKMTDEITTSLMLSKEMSNYYLYLEKANDFQIFVPNVSHAYAYTNKNSVMLYINRQEEGRLCGLPNACPCVTQEILQVTNKQPLHTLAQNNTERVFGYESNGITINLITSGISTSEVCRKPTSVDFNETTLLMWIRDSPNGAVDHHRYLENLVGYISGVEFFSYNENSYVVITRSYDPIQNTHNVPCLVFKITKEKEDFQLIQTITVESAWVLHLFKTVQGITIIIGSLSTTSKLNNDFGVSVYRFSEERDQFFLLRRIPSNGCTTAVGLTLDSDSFVVIGDKDGLLQVFQYHPEFDNYYFSHNIFTDTLVIGLSVFYGGEIGSDPYLCVVTENGGFTIYSYRYVQKWKLLSSGELEGLQLLVPFQLEDSQYLFGASNELSVLLKVVKHGSN